MPMSAVESDEHPETQNHTVDEYQRASSEIISQQVEDEKQEGVITHEGSLVEQPELSGYVTEQATAQQSNDTLVEPVHSARDEGIAIPEGDLNIPSDATESKSESLPEPIPSMEPDVEQDTDDMATHALEGATEPAEKMQSAIDVSVPDSTSVQDTASTPTEEGVTVSEVDIMPAVSIAPMLVKENAAEVHEAEPEPAASTTEIYDAAPVTIASTTEVCEAEPTSANNTPTACQVKELIASTLEICEAEPEMMEGTSVPASSHSEEAAHIAKNGEAPPVTVTEEHAAEAEAVVAAVQEPESISEEELASAGSEGLILNAVNFVPVPVNVELADESNEEVATTKGTQLTAQEGSVEVNATSQVASNAEKPETIVEEVEEEQLTVDNDAEATNFELSQEQSMDAFPTGEVSSIDGIVMLSSSADEVCYADPQLDEQVNITAVEAAEGEGAEPSHIKSGAYDVQAAVGTTQLKERAAGQINHIKEIVESAPGEATEGKEIMKEGKDVMEEGKEAVEDSTENAIREDVSAFAEPIASQERAEHLDDHDASMSTVQAEPVAGLRTPELEALGEHVEIEQMEGTVLVQEPTVKQENAPEPQIEETVIEVQAAEAEQQPSELVAEEVTEVAIANVETSSLAVDTSVPNDRVGISVDGPESQSEIITESSDVPNQHVEVEVFAKSTPAGGVAVVAGGKQSDAVSAADAQVFPHEDPQLEPAKNISDYAAPVIAVTTEDSGVTMALEAEVTSAATETESERPKSPWTPSYSVTTQGPGIVPDDSAEIAALEKLSPAAEFKPEVQAELQITSHPESAEEVLEEVVSTVQKSPRTWALSYTMSSHGTSPRQDPQQPLDSEIEPIDRLTPQAVSESHAAVPDASEELKVTTASSQTDVPVLAAGPEEGIPTTPVIVATDESNVEIEVTVPEPQAEEAPILGEVSERPWTPSYSASQQSGSPAISLKGLDQTVLGVVQADQTSTPIENQEQSSDEQPERPWTPSYSVSRQGTSPLSAGKELDNMEDEPLAGWVEAGPSVPLVLSQETVEGPVAVEDIHWPITKSVPTPAPEEAPERPWTPSYSVIRQGSSPALTPEVIEDVPIDERLEPDMSAECAPERPRTPSYSVSQQGQSPSHSPKPLYEEPTNMPMEETPAVVVSLDEVPQRPWTPSYSVNRQGSSPLIKAGALGEDVPSHATNEEPASVDAPERPWTPSYSVTRQGSSPKIVAAELTDELIEGRTETPERPWTPSYSVARQGTSPLMVSKDLPHDSTDVSSPAKEPVVRTPSISIEAGSRDSAVETSINVQEPAKEQPAPVWTPSYSVSRQGSSHGGSPLPQSKPVEPEILESNASVTEELASEPEQSQEERPERPWTPSYSVITQGPSEKTTENTQTFPTVEITEVEQKTKPTLTRLAPVNEREQSNISLNGEPSVLYSAAPRARLESTASSRFFPGGWFSGNPKSPEENRTSLDHAAGEFSRVDNLSASPALEVPANTPVDGVPLRKAKWCTIM